MQSGNFHATSGEERSAAPGDQGFDLFCTETGNLLGAPDQPQLDDCPLAPPPVEPPPVEPPPAPATHRLEATPRSGRRGAVIVGLLALVLGLGTVLAFDVHGRLIDSPKTPAVALEPVATTPEGAELAALRDRLKTLERQVTAAKADGARVAEERDRARSALETAKTEAATTRDDLNAQTARRGVAEKDAERHRTAQAELERQAEKLRTRIAELEAAPRPSDDAAERLAAERDRADEAERARAAVQTELDAARGRLTGAEAAHRDFKGWVLLRNETRGAVSFEMRSRRWDGSWGEWTAHSLDAGKRRRFFFAGALAAQVRFKAVADGAAKAITLAPQMWPAATEPRDDMVDARYRFRADGDRLLLDFLRSDPRK
ncbi:MAG: hypothetical protein U0793_30815 [Gemmataceae bacterium]